ncbi:MAG: O-methyltransferase [Cyclobacteriaceae bacterium]|jgi:O-methyltransferase
MQENILLFQFSSLDTASIILVIVLLFLGFKYVESFWSYRISKPYAWDQAVAKKQIPKQLLRIERGFRDKVRLYNLWFQVEQLKKNKISGAFAELGVFQGETARAIHHMDSSRAFYLFDTFEGFTAEDLAQEKQTEDRFSTDMFADTSVDKVEKYINGNSNLHFKPGFFPDSADGLATERFALVHIDADLYAPTIEALKFFYAKLNKGGVIIVHDYNHNWDGIPKAIHEFMGTIPESLIELTDWQGSAMIIKNS